MSEEEIIVPGQPKGLFNQEDFWGLLAKALDLSEPQETGQEETNTTAKSKGNKGFYNRWHSMGNSSVVFTK